MSASFYEADQPSPIDLMVVDQNLLRPRDPELGPAINMSVDEATRFLESLRHEDLDEHHARLVQLGRGAIRGGEDMARIIVVESAYRIVGQ